ncbi:hypothetical protein Bca4012_065838 [Brassica carinata]
MNKNTSAADKTLNPPPLNLVDYSEDKEELTISQGSQTSQPMSNELHTAVEQLESESDVESDQVKLTRKKKNVEEEKSEPTSEAVPEEANKTSTPKKNHEKAIEVSSGESEEEDDSETTNSEGVEEVEIEDLEKDKGKKRKAPSTVPRDIPVRKSARKSFVSQVKSHTGGTTTHAEASSVKSKGRPTSAEHRLESFSSRQIIPERSKQHMLQRRPREKLVAVIPYKDPRLGEEYLNSQEEERKAAKETQRKTKKKGKSASTSTAAPPPEQSSSNPRPKKPSSFGYVPPRQSPQSAGKFQIIHLITIPAPGQPIDAEEVKLALDTTSTVIHQLSVAMQTLTSVVGQIANMLFPSGFNAMISWGGSLKRFTLERSHDGKFIKGYGEALRELTLFG